MPAVVDIQLWADTLELYRLPDLETRLAEEIQTREDADAEHSVRIAVAQGDADAAQTRADGAHGRIYEVGLAAQVYTDAAIQRLRDELRGEIAQQVGEASDVLGQQLAQEIEQQITEAVQASEAAATEMRSQYAEAQTALDLLFGTTDAILDDDLPVTRAAAEAAQLAADNNRAVLDSIFEGFTYPTAMEGIAASFAAADTAEGAKDLAEAAAVAASTSANSAAGSATTATTKATEASLSAIAAAASVTRASTGSTKMVSSEVTDVAWRHDPEGVAGDSGMHPEVIENVGFVTVPASVTTNVRFMTQIVLQWVPGMTYRVTVMARAPVTLAGVISGMVAELNDDLEVVDATYPNMGTLEGGAWRLVSFDYTIPVTGNPSTRFFRIGARTIDSIAGTNDVDIQAIILEDVTQMLTLEGYAEAAVTSAEEALVSQTAAEAAASAASSHAVTAASNASDAQDSATAAAGSASTAATYRTDTEALAQSALASATNASTSAGQASTSASQASVSRISAEGAAVAANASAVVSATARSEAAMISGATGFELGLEGWVSPDTGLALSPASWSVGPQRGRATALHGPVTGGFCTQRHYDLIPARRYRIRASFVAYATGATEGTVRVYAGWQARNAAGAFGTTRWPAVANAALTYAEGWRDFTSEPFTLADVQAVMADASGIRLRAWLNYQQAFPTLWSACDGIWLEDVTDLVELEATVTQTSAALATTQGAMAGFQWIAQAGPGTGAGIEAVSIAVDGEVTRNTVLLHGEVIAPRSLSTAQMLVMDLGENLVPDDQLQSQACWGGVNSGFGIVPNSLRVGAPSIGEMRWTNAGGATGVKSSSGLEFPVRANERLVCSFWGSRIGGTQARCIPYLDFTENNSGLAENIPLSDLVSTTTVPAFRQTEVVAPYSGTARWRWRILADDTDAGMRLWAPKVIRKQDAATLLLPDSITTPLLVAEAVTVDKIKIDTLQALNGWIVNAMIENGAINNAKIGNLQVNAAKIANLTVGRLQIADNGVSDYARVSGVSPIDPPRGVWSQVCSVVLVRNANSRVKLRALGGWENMNLNNPIQFRLVRRRSGLPDVILNTFPNVPRDSTGGFTSFIWDDVGNYSGTTTFQLEVFVQNSHGGGFRILDRYLSAEEMGK
jgi:hypothetical protein